MRLYYMTSAHWAAVILKERRLKLSRFYEANDPFELNLINSRDPDRRRVVRAIEAHHNEHTGMVCFGLSWENPMMWAHYADKHQGICLGFEVADHLVSEVDYTDEKIDVDLGPHLPDHGLSAELLQKVVLTKSTVWRAEQERRALAKLTVPDPVNGLYYVEFGQHLLLRSVIIGHRCSWATSTAEALVGIVEKPVRIWKVRPAFGRFAMVEQQGIPAITVKPPKAPRRKPVALNASPAQR